MQGGGTYSFNIGQLLKAALANGTASTWLQGPQATEMRIDAPVTGSLHLTFDIRRYADGSTMTDVGFNNDRAMQASGGTVTYSATITQNGKTVLSQSNITQYQYQTWDQQVWSNGAPQVNVQHDIAALEATGAIPNFDLSVGIASSTIGTEASRLGSSNFGILGAGYVTKSMPTTGGRPDIGLQPGWTAAWLLTQNASAAQYALAQANIAGSIPWHMFDPTTGGYLTATKYPKLWINTDTHQVSASGAQGLAQLPLTGSTSASGWTPDASHEPDMTYVAYLMTGDRVYLDQLNAEASWDVLTVSPTSRQGASGLVVTPAQPLRADGWSLREIVEAASANPDGSAMKAYFTQIAANTIQYLLSQLPTWTAQEGQLAGWLPDPNARNPGATTPFAQDMLATTLGLAAGLGIQGAAQLLAWQTNFLAGRFINGANGFDPRNGVQYQLQVADPSSDQDYTTWAQAQTGSVAQGLFSATPSMSTDAEYQTLAKAALADSITYTGSTQAIQAYGWLLANATASNTSYLQSTPQDDVVPRLADGQLLTANHVFILNDTSAAAVKGTNADQLIHEQGTAPVSITGGSGIDLLFGGNSSAATLIGGAGNDDLFGAVGTTVFQAGSGNDFMRTGGGAGTFNLATTDIGSDIIAGFRIRTDHLQVTGTTASKLLTGATVDGSGSAVLHLSSSHTVTLQGIAKTQLVSSMFS